MSENKGLEKKEPVTEELSPEQMGEATGAGIVDSFNNFCARVGCVFGRHDYVYASTHYTFKNDNRFEKYKCRDCGKVIYYNCSGGQRIEMSEEEYEAQR